MKFVYDADLLEYMEKKGKKNIIVEVVTCNSDFDLTELHVFLADDKRAKFFIEKKHYRSVSSEVGQVLLPPYRLEYQEEIRFGLKQIWLFKSLMYEGIKL